MRSLVTLLLPIVLTAQIYVYDVDGRKVKLPSPTESRKRTVIEDAPGRRVTEELIERRDVNGNKLPPEKIRIVERDGDGGSRVVETTVFEADLNGRVVPTERTVTTTQTQGTQTFTTSVVERPTANGGLSVVEKEASQSVTAGGKEQTTRSTFVLDQSGNFIEAVREQIERSTVGKEKKEVVQEFRNAPTGKMELTERRVKVETPNPEGGTTSEVSIYGVAAQGRTADGTLKLREQQLVTVKPGPGNTQVESISIRRPDLSDSKMGAYQKVGERVSVVPPKPPAPPATPSKP